VEYRTVTGEITNETILSRPFIVYSDRKKAKPAGKKLSYLLIDIGILMLILETPEIVALKPSEAVCNQATEVWIKGKNFGERGEQSERFTLRG